MPGGGIRQAHFPSGYRRPGALSSGTIPDAHFPEHPLACLRRPAGITDVQGLVGFHPDGVPQVAIIAVQFLARRGGEDAVGGLPGTAFGGRELPAQPGLGRVDAHRVGAVFANQATGLDGGRAGGGGREQGSQQDVWCDVHFSWILGSGLVGRDAGAVRAG